MRQYNRGSQIAAQLANNAVTPAVQGVNLADAIDAFKGGMDWAQQYQDNQRAYNQKLALQGLTEDYGEAVKNGDTGLQNAILAQLDPAGYQRNQLLDKQMQQEQENWQRNFDANNVYKNAMLELQRQKAGQNGMTDKIRNYEYFAEKFGPERAALLVSPGSEAVGSALVSGPLGVAELGKKGQGAYDMYTGKALAEKESARQDFEALKPKAYEAIARAEAALSDGVGIGPMLGRLGSIGISSVNGGENQADINAANSQMNAVLRQKLAATGLTGSELNSALEAQAYRYTIDPSMNPAYIRQQIQNFKNDYLSGKAQTDYKSKYGLE